jgi:hypothetical protein
VPPAFLSVWLSRGKHDREGEVARCSDANRMHHFGAHVLGVLYFR